MNRLFRMSLLTAVLVALSLRQPAFADGVWVCKKTGLGGCGTQPSCYPVGEWSCWYVETGNIDVSPDAGSTLPGGGTPPAPAPGADGGTQAGTNPGTTPAGTTPAGTTPEEDDAPTCVAAAALTPAQSKRLQAIRDAKWEATKRWARDTNFGDPALPDTRLTVPRTIRDPTVSTFTPSSTGIGDPALNRRLTIAARTADTEAAAARSQAAFQSASDAAYARSVTGTFSTVGGAIRGSLSVGLAFAGGYSLGSILEGHIQDPNIERTFVDTTVLAVTMATGVPLAQIAGAALSDGVEQSISDCKGGAPAQ